MKSTIKHLMTAALAAMLLLSALPFTVSAAEKGATGACTWTLDRNGTLTISGTRTMGAYNTEKAPWGTAVKKLIVKDGVKNIGVAAFAGCTQLTDVQIADSVKYVSADAFRGCTALKTITLPDHTCCIGNDAFAGCVRLSEVDMPAKLTAISSGAFSGCESLSTVILPNGLTSIDEFAFKGCKKLHEIEIPASVISIGQSSFHDCCTGLTIYGKVNSYAHRYATQQQLLFMAA